MTENIFLRYPHPHPHIEMHPRRRFIIPSSKRINPDIILVLGIQQVVDAKEGVQAPTGKLPGITQAQPCVQVGIVLFRIGVIREKGADVAASQAG